MAFSRAPEFNLEQYLQSITAKAIAHPARIVILQYLQDQGVSSFDELNRIIPLARTTVSYHVRVLRQTHLIIPMDDGEYTFYELDDEQCCRSFEHLHPLVTAFI